MVLTFAVFNLIKQFTICERLSIFSTFGHWVFNQIFKQKSVVKTNTITIFFFIIYELSVLSSLSELYIYYYQFSDMFIVNYRFDYWFYLMF